MADPWDKSKRRSNGKSGKKSPRNRAFYLDECYDCQEVKKVLDAKGVKYRVYKDDVPANSSIQDENVIPHIGTKLFLTEDADQRRKERVRAELQRCNVRTFVLPSNMGAIARAELVAKCRKRMIEFASKQPSGFFIASVDKEGKIELRMDKKGSVHGRKKE